MTLYATMLVLIPSRLIIKPLGGTGTPAGVIGLIALAWWGAARWLPGSGMSWGRQPVRVAMAIFASAMLLGYAAAWANPLTPLEYRSADRGLIALLGWLGIALLIADGIPDRAALDRLLRRVVLLGAVLAFLGLLQFQTGIDLASFFTFPGLTANAALELYQLRAGFRRVAGTAIHPIEFSVVLAMIMPLALHYALHPVDATSRRWLRWAPVLLSALAIPVSLSRSGFVVLAVAGLVLFVGWPPRQRLHALLLAPFCVVALRLLLPGILGTIRSLFLSVGVDPSISGRTDDYAVVAGFFRDSPLIGRGLETFVAEQHIILDNQYLRTLIETGLVGLLALLSVFIVAASAARGARHRAVDASTRDLGQSLAASMLGGAASFALFDALAFPMAAGITFLLVGTAGALWRTTNSGLSDAASRTFRPNLA